MKVILSIIAIFSCVNLFSIDTIGRDSNGEPIVLFQNEVDSDIAILLIGGIHGDEKDTVEVVNYLRKEMKSSFKTFFIPSINPTLYKYNRRGYLRENLTSLGEIKLSNKIGDFNKQQYYEVFYGNKDIYNNQIYRFIDPNRDFQEKLLPSTRALVKFMNSLSATYKELIVLSFHGYMDGGKVYPEYTLVEDKKIKISSRAWGIAEAFEKGSSYQAEQVYGPSVQIIERFKGELLSYTGKFSNIISFDIELNINQREMNNAKSLAGIISIEEFLIQNK